MTYLSRPVWTFAINWAAEPAASWSYDLRETQLGFGRPDYSPLQRHILRGWQFKLLLESPVAIAAFDAFLDGTKGRLHGFWFPVPVQLAAIVAAASSTQFDLAGFGLADVWTADAGVHLILTDPAGTQTAVRITAVAAVGLVDRVTVTPALPSTPTSAWQICRLQYVRFTDDNEQADHLAEGRQERSVRVVELPEEYSTAETGEEPVFLYRFYREIEGTTYNWRYTSFAEDLTSGGEVFAAANLTHGPIKRSTKADREDVTVDALRDTDTPWNADLPNPSQFPLWVEISQAQYATPDTVTILFTGRENAVRFKGMSVSMTYSSWIDSLDSRVPHMPFGPRCPYALYSPMCGVDPAIYVLSATLFAQKYQQVVVSITGSFAIDWFTGGRFTTGSGSAQVVRSILSSSADDGGIAVLLVLNAPLPAAVAIGDAIALLPGCNKTNGDGGCPKFTNDRFGGTPFVPRSNLVFKVAEVDSTAGGKKG